MYDRNQWDFLERFWRAHLTDRGVVLLGEPGRNSGDVFIDWIAKRGWQLEQFQQTIPTREAPIRLFKVSAKKYG